MPGSPPAACQKCTEERGKLLVKHVIDAGHPNHVKHEHPHLTHTKQTEHHSGGNHGRVGTQRIHDHRCLTGSGTRQRHQKDQQQCAAGPHPEYRGRIHVEKQPCRGGTQRPAQTAEHPGLTVFKSAAAADTFNIGFDGTGSRRKTKPIKIPPLSAPAQMLNRSSGAKRTERTVQTGPAAG